jgi:hypothetical protein
MAAANNSIFDCSGLMSECAAILLDLPQMKLELSQKAADCQQRGLAHSYKWLAEISYAIR